VGDAVHKIRKQLAPEIALIGFSGAPFTLASYLIEGAGSKNYITTKSFMYTQPAAWDELMTKLSDSLVTYVNGQIQAGADAIQLFDSWVGCLSPADYERFVLPYMKSLVQRITPNVPVIYFGTQTSGILELMKQAGTQVMGVDWRVDLDVAWSRLGDVAIQGNLDPVTLFSGVEDIQRQAKRILNQANGRSGHIFNLGHGIFPQTPVDHVRALVDYVHSESAKQKESFK
jgi:uroporphyrinogen decarboxylase